jgi:electron transfer flavoprotein alpha subunit
MVNTQEIRRDLDKDELDYPALAVAYGESILPQLKEIVIEDVPRLASKAAYLAGLLAGENSHEIVALAARSRHDVVRVSAASAAASLPTQHAIEITATLLQDADPGIRVMAAKSAGKMSSALLSARLREMATQDTDSHVRSLAADLCNMPYAEMTEGTVSDRMLRVDMTEGAATGRMPGVEIPEATAADRMLRVDMTEGAVTGRMPGVEIPEATAADKMPGVDVRKRH